MNGFTYLKKFANIFVRDGCIKNKSITWTRNTRKIIFSDLSSCGQASTVWVKPSKLFVDERALLKDQKNCSGAIRGDIIFNQ